MMRGTLPSSKDVAIWIQRQLHGLNKCEQKSRLHTRVGGLILAASLLAGSPIAAQNQTRFKPTGHFGQLRYDKESGDTIGLELFIVLTRSGYMAVVQVAEGAPETPVVVAIAINGSAVAFTLPDGNSSLRFQGTLDAEGILGRFDNGAFSARPDGQILLRRGNSHWQ
jgi:hypothetical protein